MDDLPPASAARRVLVASYWYPPAIGAASERMFGFASNLPTHGWDVHVRTAARPGAWPATPGVTVHAVEDPAGAPGAFADYDPRARPPAWKALARRLVFPDRFVRWRRAAARFGAILMQTMPFDVVVATFPPASVVQLGLQLCGVSSARLVLDLRDRWFGPGGYEVGRGLTYRRHRALQAGAFAAAARIIVVSEAMAEALAAEWAVPRGRIAVIPNGYDVIPREDAEIVAAIEQARGGEASATNEAGAGSGSRPLTIAHVGTVIERNRPDVFFRTLAELREDPRLAGVSFRFVGNLSADYVRDMGLAASVQATGLVDRRTAAREMRTADALLLLTGAYVGRWGTSAKLFEYLQAGRAVLCLEEAPGSNDRAMLERFIPDRAFFAPMGDAAALAAQISRIRAYCAARPGPALELDAAVREFSRAALAAKLAGVLGEVAASAATGA